MLCHVMPCYVMPWYAMACYAMHRYNILRIFCIVVLDTTTSTNHDVITYHRAVAHVPRSGVTVVFTTSFLGVLAFVLRFRV